MRSIFTIFVVFSCMFSQDLEKIIHLTDGSLIRGTIVEEKPLEYIKIYNGNSVQKIELNAIDRISSINTYSLQMKTGSFLQQTDLSNRTWSICFGANYGNYFTIKKDMKIAQNFASHLIIGYPHVLGIGLTAESNYNQNGMRFTTLLGYNMDTEANNIASSLAYQWRIGSSNVFLSLGLMLSNGVEHTSSTEPASSSSTNVIYNTETSTKGIELMALPVFSFDIRI